MGKGNTEKMRAFKQAIVDNGTRSGGGGSMKAPAARQASAPAPAPAPDRRTLLADNSQEVVSEEEKRKQMAYRGTLFNRGSY